MEEVVFSSGARAQSFFRRGNDMVDAKSCFVGLRRNPSNAPNTEVMHETFEPFWPIDILPQRMGTSLWNFRNRCLCELTLWRERFVCPPTRKETIRF